MDLYYFAAYFQDLIINQKSKFLELYKNPHTYSPIKNNLKIDFFEEQIDFKIKVFEEAFNIRILNSYQFEEINDFDLDFNGSIQQLLSAFNTIAISIGNIFIKDNQYAPVVQLHLKNTVSNIDSINFDAYHLTSPEFVFHTLIKEVLNAIFNYDNLNYKNSCFELESKFQKDPIGATYIDEGKLKINNLFIDAIRLYYNNRFEFEVYEFWHWSYALQNTSMYDVTGLFNESYFEQELIRIVVLFQLMGKETGDLKCPTNDLYYLWVRYFDKINMEIRHLFDSYTHEILSFRKFVYSEFLNLDTELLNFENLPAKDLKSYLKFATISGIDIEDGNSFEANNFTLNFSKGIKSDLENGNTIVFNKNNNSNQFLQLLISSFLKIIYEDCNYKISVLNRDWETGKPLSKFLKNSEVGLYHIDPFGGVFFSSNENSKNYFIMRNALLESLISFSLKEKFNIYFND